MRNIEKSESFPMGWPFHPNYVFCILDVASRKFFVKFDCNGKLNHEAQEFSLLFQIY